MVFVIGGSASGAKEFALAYYVKSQALGDLILNYQEEIRDCSLEDAMKQTKALIEKNADSVIHMQEMGCGVVPMEKRERDYREMAGRVSCLLAKEAHEVYRVICGIEQKIK